MGRSGKGKRKKKNQISRCKGNQDGRCKNEDFCACGKSKDSLTPCSPDVIGACRPVCQMAIEIKISNLTKRSHKQSQTLKAAQLCRYKILREG